MDLKEEEKKRRKLSHWHGVYMHFELICLCIVSVSLCAPEKNEHFNTRGVRISEIWCFFLHVFDDKKGNIIWRACRLTRTVHINALAKCMLV